MASVEVEQPAAAAPESEMPEQQEAAAAENGGPKAPAEEEGYDASLLTFVKGRAKRPERPDSSERDVQLEKLQEQINKASDRIKEIKALLDARSAARTTGGSPEQQAIRAKLAELRAEWDTVLLQKKRLQTQNDDRKTERDRLFAEQRALKESIRGPTNLQAVEEAIARMEYELTHESLSAEREKALRERKERAERNDRPAAQRMAQISAKIDEAKAASEAIRSDIAALNARLDSIKAAREAQDAALSGLRAADAEARADVPALNVEKKELWEVINALRDKQREIRAAFNAKWDDFKKVDKAWKGWYAEERKKRNEQRHQEYLERQAARAARDAVHKPVKFEMEVYTCEQVLSYLRQFVPAVDKAGPGDKAAKADAPEPPAPGMKLLAKKGAGDEDSLYSGKGSKKGRGARKAAEKQKAAEAVKLLPKVLPLETLKTFHELGLTPPTSNDDVPAAIEAVAAKKAEFEAKRDKAAAEPPSEEAEEEPKAEAEPEAEPAAAADGDADKDEGEKAAPAKPDPTPAEANGSAPPAADANGDAPKAAEGEGKAEAEAEKAEEEPKKEPKAATANGNTTEARAASPAKAKAAAAGDVGVKLRVTDDGEVNVEVTATTTTTVEAAA